jgi:hypothetical protein
MHFTLSLQCTCTQSERDRVGELLRARVLAHVRGGAEGVLRAFRHFRPAALGRRLYLDYPEVRPLCSSLCMSVQ